MTGRDEVTIGALNDLFIQGPSEVPVDVQAATYAAAIITDNAGSYDTVLRLYQAAPTGSIQRSNALLGLTATANRCRLLFCIHFDSL